MKFDADVGSIIYVLDSKTHALVPMQVVEEITKRTITGTEQQHIVRNSSGKCYTIEEMTSPVFNDLDTARAFLLETAEKLVSATVAKAQAEAEAKFTDAAQATTGAPGAKERIVVDLGNGQRANLNIQLPNGY